jgi:hypothetical protein
MSESGTQGGDGAHADAANDAAADAKGPRDLDFQQARLAYSIIGSLLEHTSIISDLIALMAQVLDEETTKALTNTPYWKAYLESRRAMERTREDVEEFAAMMKKLGGDENS